MRPLLNATLLIVICAVVSQSMHAQSGGTRVTRIEVDEKEVHDEYKVLFDAGNYWI